MYQLKIEKHLDTFDHDLVRTVNNMNNILLLRTYVMIFLLYYTFFLFSLREKNLMTIISLQSHFNQKYISSPWLRN